MAKCQEKGIKEAFSFVRGQDQGESPKGKTYWRKLEFKGRRSCNPKKNAVKNEEIPIPSLEYYMSN